MHIPTNDAMAHIIRGCRELMKHDIANVKELLERTQRKTHRTFREDVAINILMAMTLPVGRMLVPHPDATEQKFLDDVALNFSHCESDKPMHLHAYKPGQLAEQLICTFWDEYNRLDDETSLDDIVPMQNLNIPFPKAPRDRAAELRKHIAAIAVTTFGQYTLPWRR